MSLVADYGSSSESESELDKSSAPIPTFATSTKPKSSSPRKIVLSSVNSSTATANVSSTTKAGDQPEDKSVSIFGTRSISSFLPAPKNRKQAGNGSTSLQKSNATRTLGGGIRSTFDGDVVGSSSPSSEPQRLNISIDNGSSYDSSSSRVMESRIVPASVLARRAKLEKLKKQGKPVPTSLAKQIEKDQANEIRPTLIPTNKAELTESSVKKIDLGSALGISSIKQGPSLPDESSDEEELPVAIPNDSEDLNAVEQDSESGMDLDTTRPPSIMDEVARYELGNSRKRTLNQTESKVIDFSIDEFYDNNEELRKQGAFDSSKLPVRAIGSGRHQLTSLIRSAESNKEGLEEMFIQNKRAKREAGNKYGF